jgi:carboxyl-terminal processing protease
MKKLRYSFIYPLVLVLLSSIFLFSSCKKDEEDDEQSVIENQEFYKLMTEWYYWYDKIPNINPSSYPSPYEVMEALRHRPLDRWSYVTSKEEFESYFIESKFIGYGFGSAFDQDGKLRVTFIFNTTDLYDNGVRRSWIIEKINGSAVGPGVNINQLLGPNEIGVSNKFLFSKPDGTQEEMTIQKKEVFMNTVLHKEVLQVGNSKVGYLVFQGFTTPSFDELEVAVDFFNSEGIDDLILDLRYNGGGQTDVANYLASIIGGPAVADKAFAKYFYNDKQKNENFTDNFRSEQKTLDLGRLITIATRATASASEMVINGLRPFINVHIIGDNTYGKPMGMNAWYYGDIYAFVPVTFKIANADSFGDYFDGLQADSYVPDDITRFFGDPDESSLKEALTFIETGSFSGLPRKKSLYVQPYEQMTGLRAEIGAH